MSRKMSQECAVLLGILLCASPLSAQSVRQSGNVTPGHISVWATQGVLVDGGVPGGPIFTGSTTQNDFACVGSGSPAVIIDCGLSATGANNWTGVQNFNGGLTAPTRSPGDNTTNAATTAFVQAALQAVTPIAPQGRLTLTSGVPVMSQTSGSVSGATSLIYTPYQGNIAPIYNGSQFINTTCAEISNVLANSATGSAGPFAAVPNAVYDVYLWNNSGCTLTRSDFWQQLTTVTNTNASPAVFTQNGHGMGNGTPVRLICIGGGSLSPGFTANQTYFVVSTATNTFDLAATVGGSAINAGGASTCGSSQQATEALGGPIQNTTTAVTRGAAVAQTLQNGFLVNTLAIANGPSAGLGTYLGTIATNSAGTLDYIFGWFANGGTAGSFQVWNNYNRRRQGTSPIDLTAAYTYTSATWRVANNSMGNSISFVQGLREDSVCVFYTQQIVTTANAGSFGAIAISFDTPTIAGLDTGPATVQTDAAIAHTGTAQLSSCHNRLVPGWHQWVAMEAGDGTHANSFGASGAFAGGFLSFDMWN